MWCLTTRWHLTLLPTTQRLLWWWASTSTRRYIGRRWARGVCRGSLLVRDGMHGISTLGPLFCPFPPSLYAGLVFNTSLLTRGLTGAASIRLERSPS